MNIPEFLITFTTLPAIHHIGLAMLASSIASILAISVMRVSATRGRAYDQAVLTALEADKASKIANGRLEAVVHQLPSAEN